GVSLRQSRDRVEPGDYPFAQELVPSPELLVSAQIARLVVAGVEPEHVGDHSKIAKLCHGFGLVAFERHQPKPRVIDDHCRERSLAVRPGNIALKRIAIMAEQQRLQSFHIFLSFWSLFLIVPEPDSASVENRDCPIEFSAMIMPQTE